MTWSDILFESSLRTVVVAAVVGLALLALRVRSTTVQLSAWTLVLATAVAMPLLVATPSLRLPVAVLPASWSDLPSTGISHTVAGSDDVVSATLTTTSEEGTGPLAPPAIIWSWRAVLTAIYLAGVAMLLVRAALGWVMVVRLERSALDIDDAEVRDRFARHAGDLGLGRVPRLAAHNRLFVPISTSVVRPAILLPDDWSEWTPAKLDAVLVHELAHVARHDMFVRRLSLIYRAAFWISPLSWWLHHRIAVLGERASDEATLARGIDQATYAATLLAFFRAPQQPRLASWHVAMARGRDAERRVEWILDWEAPMSGRMKSTMVGLAVLLVPAVIAAAIAQPVPSRVVQDDAALLPDVTPPVANVAGRVAGSSDRTGADDRAVVTPATIPASDGRQASGRQSATPTQPSGVVTIATPQRGAPVTLLDARYNDAAKRMLSVQVRNDSTKVVRAIVLATVVRFDAGADVPAAFRGAGFAGEHAIAGAAETSPKSFAISWSTMTMRLDPAALVSMTVRLPDSSMEAAIAAGAKVELGVVRVEFADEAPWTYDVRAAGSFERVIRHDVQDGQDRIYTPDTPGLVLPSAVERGAARYTADALRMKIQGTVEIEVVVREDGSVGGVRVVKSLDPTYGLDDSAVAAAQGYRFTPGTLSGKPVRVLCHLSIDYRLH